MFVCTRRKLFALVLLCVAGSSGAATVTVTANANFTFTPSAVTINDGDTVTFVNSGNGFHNAVSNDNGATFNSGAASSSNWTFTTPPLHASIGFHCAIHSNMTGTITVNAAPASIKLGGYLSGNWFMPSQGGGQGFQLEFNKPAPNTTAHIALAIWFAYTPAGSTANDGSGQNWIYSQGDYDPNTSSVTLPAILLAGARFPPNFDPNAVHRVPDDASLWGHLTFTFSDCNNGTVTWHSDLPGYNNANDTPLAIQRLTAIDGTACPQ